MNTKVKESEHGSISAAKKTRRQPFHMRQDFYEAGDGVPYIKSLVDDDHPNPFDTYK